MKTGFRRDPKRKKLLQGDRLVNIYAVVNTGTAAQKMNTHANLHQYARAVDIGRVVG